MRPLLIAAAVLVAAGCANSARTADPLYDFDAYDADRDGFVTAAEFNTGFARTPYYRGYDTDRDGFINDREYYGGVYSAFDTDRDGVLNRNEFGVGFRPYGI